MFPFPVSPDQVTGFHPAPEDKGKNTEEVAEFKPDFERSDAPGSGIFEYMPMLAKLGDSEISGARSRDGIIILNGPGIKKAADLGIISALDLRPKILSYL